MKKRIDWKKLQHLQWLSAPTHTLSRGEEKMLTEEEIVAINQAISKATDQLMTVVQSFGKAKWDFACKSQFLQSKATALVE